MTVLTMLSVSACATAGPADTFCDVARPIYFDKADQVSTRTELAIIKHNEKGAALCGWK